MATPCRPTNKRCRFEVLKRVQHDKVFLVGVIIPETGDAETGLSRTCFGIQHDKVFWVVAVILDLFQDLGWGKILEIQQPYRGNRNDV